MVHWHSFRASQFASHNALSLVIYNTAGGSSGTVKFGTFALFVRLYGKGAISHPTHKGVVHMRSRPTHFIVILGTIMLLALTGCGSTSTVAGVPTDLPPGGAVTPSADLNGCPVQQIPVDGAPKADVVLTPGGTQTSPEAASVKVGQRLRVQLPANVLWHLSGQDPNKSLEGIEPFGYYAATSGQCIWDFTAMKAGTVELTFSGGLVCTPNTSCPAIAEVADYAVTVK
jgi:hypothetical protein